MSEVSANCRRKSSSGGENDFHRPKAFQLEMAPGNEIAMNIMTTAADGKATEGHFHSLADQLDLLH